MAMRMRMRMTVATATRLFWLRMKRRMNDVDDDDADRATKDSTEEEKEEERHLRRRSSSGWTTERDARMKCTCRITARRRFHSRRGTRPRRLREWRRRRRRDGYRRCMGTTAVTVGFTVCRCVVRAFPRMVGRTKTPRAQSDGPSFRKYPPPCVRRGASRCERLRLGFSRQSDKPSTRASKPGARRRRWRNR